MYVKAERFIALMISWTAWFESIICLCTAWHFWGTREEPGGCSASEALYLFYFEIYAGREIWIIYIKCWKCKCYYLTLKCALGEKWKSFSFVSNVFGIQELLNQTWSMVRQHRQWQIFLHIKAYRSEGADSSHTGYSYIFISLQTT